MNIGLQLELTTAGSIVPSASVVFDNTSYLNGNISYNSTTGVITINEVGRFQLNWWINTQSLPNGDTPEFTLSTSQGDLIASTSPIKTGEVVGIGLIEITAAPVTLSIVNTSSSTVYLPTTTSTVATFTIVQDDDVSSASASAIIPYASGIPAIVTTVLGGVLNAKSLIGFGSALTGITLIGGAIDASGVTNFAFSVPRDGVITSISAYFSVTVAVTLLTSTATVSAQLYQSAAPNNTFTPIPGAIVNLTPSFSGTISLGDIAFGTASNLSIPVSAGTRLLFVFSSSITDGLDVASTLTGYASGGVAIS